MAEYKHGSMDIRGHQKTFDGFLRGITWVGGISIGILVFLALFNS